MKVIDFPSSNAVYANSQPEYLPLPSHKTPDGLVTSCWKPTFWECVQLIMGAKLWLTVMTFNKPLQPQRLEVGSEMPIMHRRMEIKERK